MRIAVLQPGYIPWLGFFDQEISVDLFVVLDDVQYDRRGWRNRNRLKSPDGPTWLTVPVESKGKFDQLIADVKIQHGDGWKDAAERRILIGWRKKHLGILEHFYKSAPYYNKVYQEFNDIISLDWEHLWELDLAVINWMNHSMGIDTPLKMSSDLHVSGNKTGKLLEICRYFDADQYYSGAAARHYLDVERLRENGIDVYYQEYEHPVYPQLHGNFISHLSALDLMMVALPESKKIIKSGSKWVRAD